VANYDAVIKLVVQGEQALERIQTRIDKLYKTISDLETKKKYAGSEKAVELVRKQANELDRVASISKNLIKQDENRLIQQSKLNAAVALYERRLKQVVNSGASELDKFKTQVQQIGNAFTFFKDRKNVTAVQALATELGRMVEYSNAVNKSQRERAANVSKLWTFNKQIVEYQEQGLNVSRAQKTFDKLKAVADTDKVTQAKKYTEALTRQLSLLKDQSKVNAELAKQDSAKLTALKELEAARSAAARGRLAQAAEQRTFLAGAQAYAYPIGPNVSSGRRTAAFGEVSAVKAERALIEKEKRILFEQEKRQLAELDQLRAANITRETNRYKGLGKTIQGSLSSAVIGGAFPLLFGQSTQAAVGGALGGLLGGPAGGFAGSLLGTALGDLLASQSAIQELGLELGFSATQADELARAFDLAGQNSDQLRAAVTNIQGLGLSTEETASAIKISNELAEEYGGKVDKIAQAFANTLESGKVSISTLNSFTAQGIPIQEELAQKLGVSRSALLEMAKDGKIAVQDVIDILVDMGREAEKTANDAKTGFDKFTESAKGLAIAIADGAGVILKNLVPALNAVLDALSSIITKATTALAKIADLDVGGVYGAVTGSGFTRGMGLGSKQNIDDITNALRKLNPALAQNSADIVKYRQAIAAANTELSKFGGAIGEYSEKTAQIEITRLQKIVNAREAALPKESIAATTPITTITAPTQLDTETRTKDTSAEELKKALEFTTELQRQVALKSTTYEYDRDILEIAYEYADRMERIASMEDQSQRVLQESLALRIQELDIEKAKSAELERQRKFAEDFIKTKTAGASYASAEIANLQELTKAGELVIYAADSIGASFRSAFNDVLTGTESAEQAISDFFAAIGAALIDYAAVAIAQYIAIGIARAFAGLTTSVSGDYFSGADASVFSGGFGVDTSGSTFDSVPNLMDIPSYGGFADGGYVTAPTKSVVGEGGADEYVIPSNKMDSAMSRWNAGARGDSVVTGADPTGGGTGGMAAAEAPSQINISGGVFQYNDTNYIRQDQIPGIVSQASKQGEARALRRLQMSPSTRRKVGI